MRIWSTVLVGVLLTTSAAPAHGVDAAAWHRGLLDPPNVVGLSYLDATATLRAWQPLVEIVVLPAGVPAGADPTLLIVDNETGDETSVYVTLVTSMPGVVGMTIDEATPTLAAHGIFRVLDPADASGDSVIDSQAPDAGTTVRVDGDSGQGTSDGGGSGGGGTGLDGVPAAVVKLHVAVVLQPTTPPQHQSGAGGSGRGPGPAATDWSGPAATGYGGGGDANGSTTDEASPWTPVAVLGGGGLCVLVLVVVIIVVLLSARRRRPVPLGRWRSRRPRRDSHRPSRRGSPDGSRG